MNSYRIKGAKDSNGKVSDFFLSNGKFVNENELAKGAEVIDADGLTLLPGFVDLHAHLREPGREDAETVLSGSLAAAAGGFTAISAMPNTLPVADTAGVVEQVYRLGKHHGICDVFPIGAVTVGQGGEKLAELSAMNQSEAGVRIFSDDGYCVFDALVMRRALEYVKTFDGIIAQHAQDPRLTQDAQMNEGEISARLGLKGWPAVAEEAIIARDVLLAEHVDSRLHICHVTTAGGVEIIRTAKKRGIKVSAEVTPHHLLLTDDLAESYDPVYKVNPPLRTKDDVQALREGLADGTIDVIATDHAPHPHESKDCEWSAAAFGMVGLETAFSIAYLAMVETKLLTLSQLVDRISKIPAQIGRYEGHGSIAIGSIANFTLVDLESKWKVQRQNLASKSKNTPFDGMALPGVVKKTFHNGALVYERNSK
ncbi:MAG: dihydroorotase [Actinobacteria bacterium]|nr:dihydroorotase [Actinomycetota bacterium]NBO06671.1 dihydroorotase [Actinomycetota bacterium]NBO47605.1 dihydroorotase [Actinomycetota bacterium]NBP21861.1 dihydroorotase [Actinomycetota bacterium]NBQ00954.1 dihydroorotase [Actinomycetota bacterium]